MLQVDRFCQSQRNKLLIASLPLAPSLPCSRHIVGALQFFHGVVFIPVALSLLPDVSSARSLKMDSTGPKVRYESYCKTCFVGRGVVAALV